MVDNAVTKDDMVSSARKSGVLLNDHLLAAIMDSYNLLLRHEDVLSLFDAMIRQEGSMNEWPLCCTALIRALFGLGREVEAKSLFETISSNSFTTDMLCVTADGFANLKKWSEVLDIYTRGNSNGYRSEELATLALRALDSNSLEGWNPQNSKMFAMRTVMRDLSETLGCSPTHWLKSNYWDLKRVLRTGRLMNLMYWDRSLETARLEELEFALATIDGSGFADEPKLGKKNALPLRVVMELLRQIPPQDIPVARITEALRQVSIERSSGLIDMITLIHFELGKKDEGAAFVLNAARNGVPVYLRTLRLFAKAELSLPEDDINLLVANSALPDSE
jgi:hypothetical protein